MQIYPFEMNRWANICSYHRFVWIVKLTISDRLALPSRMAGSGIPDPRTDPGSQRVLYLS